LGHVSLTVGVDLGVFVAIKSCELLAEVPETETSKQESERAAAAADEVDVGCCMLRKCAVKRQD
jgi:hypothetical protein